MDDRQTRIEMLEQEIAALPIGYISRKNIRGKVKLYHQWTENGKKKSKYLDDDTAAELSALIEKRRSLEKEMRELRKQLPKQKHTIAEDTYTFKSDVLIGKALKPLAESVRGFERRSCYAELESFLERGYPGKVFILYGLRRTGKTTLIRQAIASLSARDFDKAAFIQVKPGITLGEINADLRWLRDRDYQYVFIDEITLAEDFIEGAALLSDIYAASGIKIVLSGTDSLGFLLSESEELFDRCPYDAPLLAERIALGENGTIYRLERDGEDARQLWRVFPWCRDGLTLALRLVSKLKELGKAEDLSGFMDSLPEYHRFEQVVHLDGPETAVLRQLSLDRDAETVSGVRLCRGEATATVRRMGAGELRILAESCKMEAAAEFCDSLRRSIREWDKG